MRDLILLAVLLGITPLTFRAPILGLLAWIWIALMNPQREVYGFLAGAGLNFVVAALTIFAWAVSREKKTIPANLTLIALGGFVVWICISTYFALVPDTSSLLLEKTLKTAVLLVGAVALGNTKTRIQAIVWAIAISLAYFGVKGGGFVIVSGGSYRVNGPADTMITDNNHLGLALVMLLPLINYLRETAQARFVRIGLLATMTLTVAAILGTYSRGALLALASIALLMAIRSRAGVLFVIAGVGLAAAAPHIMPQAWLDRMASIDSADQDSSFMGRVEAWRTSFHIATERVTGGGFSSIEHNAVIEAYPTSGGLTAARAAHSMYFQVLGDHGFVGLALFLALVGSALFNTVAVLNVARGRPDLRWADQLARMLQASIIAYMIGGAALSMAYYDGFLLILVLTAALLYTVKRDPAEAAATVTAPKWKTVEAREPALPPPTRPGLT